MNNSSGMTKSQSVQRQAIEWFNLLRTNDISEKDLVAYIEWLRRSPEHEAVLAEVETNWELIGDLKADPGIGELLKGYKYKTKKPVGRSRFFLAFASAAILVIAAAIMFLSPLSPEPTQKLYWTALGKQATYLLDDGSEMALNTATEVRVIFSKDERAVYLQRGEALFNVTADSERPFTVVTDTGSVTALGTRFNMRIKENDVLVSLLEGSVEVTARHLQSTDHPDDRKILKPGQQVSYSQAGEMSDIREINTQQVVLWQAGKLNFIDTPLKDVVAEINRYTPQKLEIGDSDIADKRINVFISIDNIDSLLSATEAFFGVQSKYQFGKIILTKPAKTIPK